MSDFIYEIFTAKGSQGSFLMLWPKSHQGTVPAAQQDSKITPDYSAIFTAGRRWGYSYLPDPEKPCHIRFLRIRIVKNPAPDSPTTLEGRDTRWRMVELYGEDAVFRAEGVAEERYKWPKFLRETNRRGCKVVKVVPLGFMRMFQRERNSAMTPVSRCKAVALVGEERLANIEQFCRDLYSQAPAEWLNDVISGEYTLP